MTSVPVRIIERRAELDNLVEHHRRALEDHKHWLAVKVAERDGIDLCIAAIEDAAKTPNAEAVEGVEPSAATQQAREAENAPAGTAEGLSGIEPKKPRAPKRPFRSIAGAGMVIVPREPTPEMSTAAFMSCGDEGSLRLVLEAGWRAMVDEFEQSAAE